MVKSFVPGKVQIASRAVASIIKASVEEVPGVARVSGRFRRGSKNSKSKINTALSSKGNINVNISIEVEEGYNMQKVAKEAQTSIANAVETMTGLITQEINVRAR